MFERDQSPLEEKTSTRARSQTRTTKTRFRKRRHFSSFFRSSVRDPMRRDGPNVVEGSRDDFCEREKERTRSEGPFFPRRRMLSRTINLFLSDHSLTCFSPFSLSLSHTHTQAKPLRSNRTNSNRSTSRYACTARLLIRYKRDYPTHGRQARREGN